MNQKQEIRQENRILKTLGDTNLILPNNAGGMMIKISNGN